MDIATIAGIISGIIIVGIAIFLGGNFGGFVDIPSVFIVVGGTIAATFIRFPLTHVATAIVLGGKVAFTHRKTEPRELIDEIANLADIIRKQGPLGLENIEVTNELLAKGIQYVADGYDPRFIQETLEKERDLNLERLDEGQRIFKAIGDAAPAFGMIGTLVGLVQMLAKMDDPSAIGPAMAVALLTTLYGALIANLVALPISDKLSNKSKIEEVNQTLILDGVMQIRDSKSPNLIREMLTSYLPEKHRLEPAAAEAVA
ncbi:MAG: MotA/TolQ/ExbB proton channel family protein [Rhodobiaceae bacterium]|nr:MotA/TolQ/ExbB proton channel family protein [Rhodobiaceae bacterium]MCC0057185.1 MotA/TolQ/ExbB proton channel family protein [Rhodobiaceae bacterium]